MPNYNQAPKIKFNGEKDVRNETLTGFCQRSMFLEEKIAQGIDSKHFAAYKLMMFLTGNKEGFSVPLKTVTGRLNISENSYYSARQYLEDKGWITCTDEYIIVNYEVIYGIRTKTPNDISAIKTPSDCGSIELTISDCGSILVDERMKTPNELGSNDLGSTQDGSLTPNDCGLKTSNDWGYNNIGDNINNNIIEGVGEEDSLTAFMRSWGF